MTLHNKNSSEKGYFKSTIINYFYVMCLLLCNTETTLKKLDGMLKKKGVSEDLTNNMLFKPLHIYFRLHETPKIYKQNLASIFLRSNDEAAKAMGTSLFYRLRVKPVWEMRLESIIAENSAKDVKGLESQSDTRLIYLLEYSLIVPILQKRRKDGERSIGRRLNADGAAHH